MDPTTGLPMAFGKQIPASSVAGPSRAADSSSTAERGGASGRGSRGVVGGGKRNRGRGGGRGGGELGAGEGRIGNEDMAMNGGVKRPHPSSSNYPSNPSQPHTNHPPPPQSFGYPTSSRSNPNGMELGPRGGGYPQGGYLDRRPSAPDRGDYDGGRGGRGRGGRGGRDDSGRGRGGGGGGGRGGHAPPERGFYKPSFVEDPWKELLEARDRASRQGGVGGTTRASGTAMA